MISITTKKKLYQKIQFETNKADPGPIKTVKKLLKNIEKLCTNSTTIPQPLTETYFKCNEQQHDECEKKPSKSLAEII